LDKGASVAITIIHDPSSSSYGIFLENADLFNSLPTGAPLIINELPKFD
jgi:hypothetical protein